MPNRDVIQHWGVLGMHWGVTTGRDSSGSGRFSPKLGFIRGRDGKLNANGKLQKKMMDLHTQGRSDDISAIVKAASQYDKNRATEKFVRSSAAMKMPLSQVSKKRSHIGLKIVGGMAGGVLATGLSAYLGYKAFNYVARKAGGALTRFVLG